MAERRGYCVSGDRSGILTPRQALLMYGPYGRPEMGCLGIEAMAWWYCPLFLCLARLEKVQVMGLHGRLGWQWEGDRGANFKVNTANLALLPTSALVWLANKFGINYILVHSYEATRNYNALLKFKGQVRIENDKFVSGGRQESRNLVRSLRKSGVNAIFNFDSVHWAAEQGFSDNPEYLVRSGTRILRIEAETGVTNHEPIGEDQSDSWNPLHVTFAALVERGKFYQQHPEVAVVFENQFPASRIKVSHRAMIDTRRITASKMRRLDQAGWFTL